MSDNPNTSAPQDKKELPELPLNNVLLFSDIAHRLGITTADLETVLKAYNDYPKNTKIHTTGGGAVGEKLIRVKDANSLSVFLTGRQLFKQDRSGENIQGKCLFTPVEAAEYLSRALNTNIPVTDVYGLLSQRSDPLYEYMPSEIKQQMHVRIYAVRHQFCVPLNELTPPERFYEKMSKLDKALEMAEKAKELEGDREDERERIFTGNTSAVEPEEERQYGHPDDEEEEYYEEFDEDFSDLEKKQKRDADRRALFKKQQADITREIEARRESYNAAQRRKAEADKQLEAAKQKAKSNPSAANTAALDAAKKEHNVANTAYVDAQIALEGAKQAEFFIGECTSAAEMEIRRNAEEFKALQEKKAREYKIAQEEKRNIAKKLEEARADAEKQVNQIIKNAENENPEALAQKAAAIETAEAQCLAEQKKRIDEADRERKAAIERAQAEEKKRQEEIAAEYQKKQDDLARRQREAEASLGGNGSQEKTVTATTQYTINSGDAAINAALKLESEKLQAQFEAELMAVAAQRAAKIDAAQNRYETAVNKAHTETFADYHQAVQTAHNDFVATTGIGTQISNATEEYERIRRENNAAEEAERARNLKIAAINKSLGEVIPNYTPVPPIVTPQPTPIEQPSPQTIPQKQDSGIYQPTTITDNGGSISTHTDGGTGYQANGNTSYTIFGEKYTPPVYTPAPDPSYDAPAPAPTPQPTYTTQQTFGSQSETKIDAGSDTPAAVVKPTEPVVQPVAQPKVEQPAVQPKSEQPVSGYNDSTTDKGTYAPNDTGSGTPAAKPSEPTVKPSDSVIHPTIDGKAGTDGIQPVDTKIGAGSNEPAAVVKPTEPVVQPKVEQPVSGHNDGIADKGTYVPNDVSPDIPAVKPPEPSVKPSDSVVQPKVEQPVSGYNDSTTEKGTYMPNDTGSGTPTVKPPEAGQPTIKTGGQPQEVVVDTKTIDGKVGADGVQPVDTKIGTGSDTPSAVVRPTEPVVQPKVEQPAVQPKVEQPVSGQNDGVTDKGTYAPNDTGSGTPTVKPSEAGQPTIKTGEQPQEVVVDTKTIDGKAGTDGVQPVTPTKPETYIEQQGYEHKETTSENDSQPQPHTGTDNSGVVHRKEAGVDIPVSKGDTISPSTQPPAQLSTPLQPTAIYISAPQEMTINEVASSLAVANKTGQDIAIEFNGKVYYASEATSESVVVQKFEERQAALANATPEQRETILSQERSEIAALQTAATPTYIVADLGMSFEEVADSLAAANKAGQNIAIEFNGNVYYSSQTPTAEAAISHYEARIATAGNATPQEKGVMERVEKIASDSIKANSSPLFIEGRLTDGIGIQSVEEQLISANREGKKVAIEYEGKVYYSSDATVEGAIVEKYEARKAGLASATPAEYRAITRIEAMEVEALQRGETFIYVETPLGMHFEDVAAALTAANQEGRRIAIEHNGTMYYSTNAKTIDDVMRHYEDRQARLETATPQERKDMLRFEQLETTARKHSATPALVELGTDASIDDVATALAKANKNGQHIAIEFGGSMYYSIDATSKDKVTQQFEIRQQALKNATPEERKKIIKREEMEANTVKDRQRNASKDGIVVAPNGRQQPVVNKGDATTDAKPTKPQETRGVAKKGRLDVDTLVTDKGHKATRFEVATKGKVTKASGEGTETPAKSKTETTTPGMAGNPLKGKTIAVVTTSTTGMNENAGKFNQKRIEKRIVKQQKKIEEDMARGRPVSGQDKKDTKASKRDKNKEKRDKKAPASGAKEGATNVNVSATNAIKGKAKEAAKRTFEKIGPGSAFSDGTVRISKQLISNAAYSLDRYKVEKDTAKAFAASIISLTGVDDLKAQALTREVLFKRPSETKKKNVKVKKFLFVKIKIPIKPSKDEKGIPGAEVNEALREIAAMRGIKAEQIDLSFGFKLDRVKKTYTSKALGEIMRQNHMSTDIELMSADQLKELRGKLKNGKLIAELDCLIQLQELMQKHGFDIEKMSNGEIIEFMHLLQKQENGKELLQAFRRQTGIRGLSDELSASQMRITNGKLSLDVLRNNKKILERAILNNPMFAVDPSILELSPERLRQTIKGMQDGPLKTLLEHYADTKEAIQMMEENEKKGKGRLGRAIAASFRKMAGRNESVSAYYFAKDVMRNVQKWSNIAYKVVKGIVNIFRKLGIRITKKQLKSTGKKIKKAQKRAARTRRKIMQLRGTNLDKKIARLEKKLGKQRKGIDKLRTRKKGLLKRQQKGIEKAKKRADIRKLKADRKKARQEFLDKFNIAAILKRKAKEIAKQQLEKTALGQILLKIFASLGKFFAKIAQMFAIVIKWVLIGVAVILLIIIIITLALFLYGYLGPIIISFFENLFSENIMDNAAGSTYYTLSKYDVRLFKNIDNLANNVDGALDSKVSAKSYYGFIEPSKYISASSVSRSNVCYKIVKPGYPYGQNGFEQHYYMTDVAKSDIRDGNYITTEVGRYSNAKDIVCAGYAAYDGKINYISELFGTSFEEYASALWQRTHLCAACGSDSSDKNFQIHYTKTIWMPFPKFKCKACGDEIANSTLSPVSKRDDEKKFWTKWFWLQKFSGKCQNAGCEKNYSGDTSDSKDNALWRLICYPTKQFDENDASAVSNLHFHCREVYACEKGYCDGSTQNTFVYYCNKSVTTDTSFPLKAYSSAYQRSTHKLYNAKLYNNEKFDPDNTGTDRIYLALISGDKNYTANPEKVNRKLYQETGDLGCKETASPCTALKHEIKVQKPSGYTSFDKIDSDAGYTKLFINLPFPNSSGASQSETRECVSSQIMYHNPASSVPEADAACENVYSIHHTDDDIANNKNIIVCNCNYGKLKYCSPIKVVEDIYGAKHNVVNAFVGNTPGVASKQHVKKTIKVPCSPNKGTITVFFSVKGAKIKDLKTGAIKTLSSCSLDQPSGPATFKFDWAYGEKCKDLKILKCENSNHSNCGPNKNGIFTPAQASATLDTEEAHKFFINYTSVSEKAATEFDPIVSVDYDVKTTDGITINRSDIGLSTEETSKYAFVVDVPTCQGHNQDIIICNGHCPKTDVVCGGHQVCEAGHHYCSGHTMTYCKGHTDVYISVTILGLNTVLGLNNGDNVEETRQEFFTAVLKEGTPKKAKDNLSIASNQLMATRLYREDWSFVYNIAIAKRDEVGDPLSDDEITRKTQVLTTGNPSSNGANMSKIAMIAIGRIPYHENNVLSNSTPEVTVANAETILPQIFSGTASVNKAFGNVSSAYFDKSYYKYRDSYGRYAKGLNELNFVAFIGSKVTKCASNNTESKYVLEFKNENDCDFKENSNYVENFKTFLSNHTTKHADIYCINEETLKAGDILWDLRHDACIYVGKTSDGLHMVVSGDSSSGKFAYKTISSVSIYAAYRIIESKCSCSAE